LEPNHNSQNYANQEQQARQPIFNLPPIVLIFIATCCAVHGVREYLLTTDQNFLVMVYGAFIPARYGQFLTFELASVTSVVTYSLLHGSWSHLLNNCLWLAAFGSPLANTIGDLRFVLFWVFCSLVATIFHFYGQPTDVTPMIGASGAVAGFMGAAARFGFSMNRQVSSSRFQDRLPPLASVFANRSVLTFLALFLATNVLIGSGQFQGLGTAIAWQAHIGGILAGFLMIPLFLPTKYTR
jgi:membrane associated rhomboid family serine protease